MPAHIAQCINPTDLCWRVRGKNVYGATDHREHKDRTDRQKNAPPTPHAKDYPIV